MKQLKFLALLGASSIFGSIQATEYINMTSGQIDFTQTITSKHLDRYAGNFYVSCAGLPGSKSDYSIAFATPDLDNLTTTTYSYFTGLAGQAKAAGSEFYNLALVNNGAVEASHLGYRKDVDNQPYVIKLKDTTTPYGVLDDFSPGFTDTTGLIVGTLNSFDHLYGNTNWLFAHVNSQFNGVDGKGSGINAIWVGTDSAGTDTMVYNGPAIQWNAFRGEFTGDGSPLRFGSTDSVMTFSPHVNDIYWSTDLMTLFITGTVPAIGAGSFSAITTATINSGKLSLMDILPNGVNPAGSGYDGIFAFVPGDNSTIIINKIRTMKTSTNKSYLIVNGGIEKVGTGPQRGNEIYCLRYSNTSMVVVQNNVNANSLQNGYAASVLAGDVSVSLTVGGGPAPWDKQYYASDMRVVGDAVYVSFNAVARDGSNDPGDWSSQAIFDNNGVIIGWTAWERVLKTYGGTNVGPFLMSGADPISLFSVDGLTGKIWAVNGGIAADGSAILANQVYRSKWSFDPVLPKKRSSFEQVESAVSLVEALDRFSTFNTYGCSCCLDIPKGIPGLGNSANADVSLALFGSFEKVVFAFTSYGNANATVGDFSSATYVKETTLPSSCVVRSLGYSRVPLGTLSSKGYFFAGCDKGLYVYSHSTSFTGFDTTMAGGLTNAAATPFSTAGGGVEFTWRKMAASLITGAISHIESDGTYLYVVEQDVTSIDSNKCRIWRITIGENVTAMETTAACVKIAESGDTNSIPENAIITGFKLTSGEFGYGQFGLISTNAGLFRSNVPMSAVTLGTAHWATVDSSNSYYSLFAPKRVPTPASTAISSKDGSMDKFFGIHFTDPDGLNYYQNSQFDSISTLTVLNSTITVSGYTNASMAAAPSPIEDVDRSLYFYTDGGRRLYTRFDPSEDTYNAMRILPYYGQPWGATEPFATEELGQVNGNTVRIPRIHWIENISSAGVILAGTDQGVLALE